MAKTNAIQKNLRRMGLVKKYAKKRAALKKIINNRKLDLSERFEAQLNWTSYQKIQQKLEFGIDVRFQEGLMVFIEN